MSKLALRDWASIAEIIGAVAAALSLIFVGVQIHENTKATQAAMLQQSVGYGIQILSQLGSNAELANDLTAFMARGYAAITEQRRAQLDFEFASMVRHWENLYLQHENGSLSDEAWSTRRRIIESVILSPGFREYVSSPTGTGSLLSGDFAEYAKGLIREHDALPRKE